MAENFLPILLFDFEEARIDFEMTDSGNFIENIIALLNALSPLCYRAWVYGQLFRQLKK